MSLEATVAVTKEVSPLVFGGLLSLMDVQAIAWVILAFYNIILILEKAPVIYRFWQKLRARWSNNGG